MNEVKRSSRKAHPGAQNTGEYVDGRGRRLASALAPTDGWYDRRYVAATAPAADLDECEDFRRMCECTGGGVGEGGMGPSLW